MSRQREGDVVLAVVGEVADVGHDVVGAGRLVDAEAGRPKRGQQEVAPVAVARDEVGVVGVREAQRDDRRGLERRRGADGQEVVDAADPDATGPAARSSSRSASR